MAKSRLFSGVPADFRCQPESRPSCPNVRFSVDCSCFTPESEPGAEGPFWSAVDPYRKFTIPAAAAYFNSPAAPYASSRHPRAVCPCHFAAGCHSAKLPASLEWTREGLRAEPPRRYPDTQRPGGASSGSRQDGRTASRSTDCAQRRCRSLRRVQWRRSDAE